MAIDPSIPLQAGTGAAAPQNPLAMAGQAVGIANAIGANKLQGVQTETAEQGLNSTRQKAISSIALNGLVHTDDRKMYDAILDGLQRAEASGVVPKAQGDGYRQSMLAARDTGHLREMVMREGLKSLDPGGMIAQIYGTPADVSNGQDLQPGMRTSNMLGGGIRPVGPAIPQFPSPESQNERVIVGYDDKNNPIMGPKASVTPRFIGGRLSGDNPMGDGRLPAALRNPANAPPPFTGNVTQPGPAAVAAQGTTGTQSAGRFQEIAEQGVQARGQEAILANMETEAAQFTQGTGQERIKNFQAAALRFANPLARAFGIDEKTVAANQSFDKLAAQIADAQGAKSDARLQVTQAANPSSSLTPDGINLILKQLRGNTDYINARANLAASWPDKADREGFEAQVGKNLDPRAFQFQRLGDTQRREFLKGIKDQADKATFQRNYMWARDKGLLTSAGQ